MGKVLHRLEPPHSKPVSDGVGVVEVVFVEEVVVSAVLVVLVVVVAVANAESKKLLNCSSR